MRTVVDQIGANYGWAKTEAPDEWWHINYVGPITLSGRRSPAGSAQPTPAGTSSSRTSTRGRSRSTSFGSRLPAPKCWVDSAPQATP